MKKFKLDQKSKIATGFTVPKDYFIDFSEKMRYQLPPEKSKLISFDFNKTKLATAVAAVVLVGLLIPAYNQFSSSVVELDSETIEQHLTYQSEIDSYELLSELEEKDIKQLQSNFPVQNETIETILATHPALETLITDY